MPGGVDELSSRTRTDGAGPDDERDAHRKSGPSSSRQPPWVGGTPPRPRKRADRADQPRDPNDEEHPLEGLHSARSVSRAEHPSGPAAKAAAQRDRVQATDAGWRAFGGRLRK